MKIVLLVLSCAISGILTASPTNFEALSLLSIQKAPFFVTIFHNGDPKCSGALISVTHVITAAHCVVDERLQKHRNITIESGTDRFHEGGSRHGVEDVAVAPGYSNENLRNDIAIITLSRRVRFEDYLTIPIIGLPSQEPAYGDAAGVVGFENMIPPEGAPLRLIVAVMESAEHCHMFDVIQYLDHSSKICAINDVPIQLFPVSNCRVAWSPIGLLKKFPLHLEMIVTEALESTKSEIYITALYYNTHGYTNADDYPDEMNSFLYLPNKNYGDGAPLVLHGKIIGIASAQGAASYHVLYYTNVYQFVPFIRSVIGESSKAVPYVNVRDWF